MKVTKKRKRLSYNNSRPTAHHDVYAHEFLEYFKEGMQDMFYGWTHFGQTLPDAIDIYFDIRPTLERYGKAKELDEAFGNDLPEDYKDMPYDPRFGFYTMVSDSEDIIQIAAPVIDPHEFTIGPSDCLPKFCQPMCGDYGFPDWLEIPPYETWFSENVLKENPQMEDVKVEVI